MKEISWDSLSYLFSFCRKLKMKRFIEFCQKLCTNIPSLFLYFSYIVFFSLIFLPTEQKAGECPVIVDENKCEHECTSDYSVIVDENKCEHECTSDCDCTGESKCCRTACGGHTCSEPGKCEIGWQRNLTK